MGSESCHQICTSNPEFIMRAQEDSRFREVLTAANLSLPDGIGLIYASIIQGERLPERVAGSDLVYRLAEKAAVNGWSLFLLGAAPGIAEEAATALVKRYPTLSIAGTYAGSPAAEEQPHIIEMINRSAPDILYVAYGAPQQDIWIADAKKRLTTVRIAIGVGGSLDFIAGRISRAPTFLQKAGLEWLYRLYLEPWRWRRMLALPQFAGKVLLNRIGQKS